MTVLPATTGGRIALAIALSLLVHALMLVAPTVELPRGETPLPPLTAKLEPLPKLASAPVTAQKPRPKPARTQSVHQPQPAPPAPATQEEAQPAAETVSAAAPAEDARPAHPLPGQAQLTFTAYRGNGGLLLGEAVHRLHSGEGQYILTAVTQTTGLVGIFKSYLLTQTSTGEADAQGLRPRSFNEEKRQSGVTQSLGAEFDHQSKILRFSHGGSTALPEQAQDILSFLYQLSQLPLDLKTLPLAVSNGKKLEHYQLEVGDEEEIETPLGRLRALPLRKVRAAGEEGLEVWLGLEYRLLPVRIRQLERNGEVAGELVISDIRVAAE